VTLVSLSTRKVYGNAIWKQRRPAVLLRLPDSESGVPVKCVTPRDVTSSCLVNKASAFDRDASRASSALYELDSWTRVRGRACTRAYRAYVRALDGHTYTVGRKVHATARQLQSPYGVWNTGAARRDTTMSTVWYSR